MEVFGKWDKLRRGARTLPRSGVDRFWCGDDFLRSPANSTAALDLDEIPPESKPLTLQVSLFRARHDQHHSSKSIEISPPGTLFRRQALFQKFISLRAIFTHTLQARVSVCTKLNYFVYTQHFPGSGSGWVSKRMSVLENVSQSAACQCFADLVWAGINVVFLLPCSSPRFLDRTSGIIRTFCRFHGCGQVGMWPSWALIGAYQSFGACPAPCLPACF